MDKATITSPLTPIVIVMTTPNSNIARQPQPETRINGIPFRFFSEDDRDVAMDWLNASSDRARTAIVSSEAEAFQTAQTAWDQDQARRRQEQEDAQRKQQQALATRREEILRSYADDGYMDPSHLPDEDLQILLDQLPPAEKRNLLAQLRLTRSMAIIQDSVQTLPSDVRFITVSVNALARDVRFITVSVNALARDVESVDVKLQEVACLLLAEQLYYDPRNSRGFLRGKWLTVLEIKDKLLRGVTPDSIFDNEDDK